MKTTIMVLLASLFVSHATFATDTVLMTSYAPGFIDNVLQKSQTVGEQKASSEGDSQCKKIGGVVSMSKCFMIPGTLSTSCASVCHVPDGKLLAADNASCQKLLKSAEANLLTALVNGNPGNSSASAKNLDETISEINAYIQTHSAL